MIRIHRIHYSVLFRARSQPSLVLHTFLFQVLSRVQVLVPAWALSFASLPYYFLFAQCPNGAEGVAPGNTHTLLTCVIGTTDNLRFTSIWHSVHNFAITV